jgi:hypothetical protein
VGTEITLSEPRYVVTELEGYPIRAGVRERGSHPPGISCHVIDRHRSHRLLATYASEDRSRGWKGGGHEAKLADARARAAEHCDRLNAEARR